MKSIEISAKSGPKKDLFKFESVNTLMGHTVHMDQAKPVKDCGSLLLIVLLSNWNT